VNTSAAIIAILAEILDLEPTDIRPETYVIRELEAQSIDLLEIGVAMQHRLCIAVDDDTLFLKNIRLILARAERQGQAPLEALAGAYPHLDAPRLSAILSDLNGGPVLTVADLVAYALAGRGGT